MPKLDSLQSFHFERNEEVIKNLIYDYSLKGFTRIKNPGGTNAVSNYYSGLYVYLYDSITKQFFFLGLPFNPTFYLTEEGADKPFDNSPEETALRELKLKTGLVAKLDDLVPICEKKKYRNGDHNDLNPHIQYFFALDFTKCDGELITQDNIDDSGENGEPILLPAKLFFSLNQRNPYIIKKIKEILTGRGKEFWDATFTF